MSSFTSVMSTASTTPADQPLNNAKNYICPKCSKPYDFQMAGNSFVGRIPLILNCKHSICQDCAHKMYSSKDVICGECHTSNLITDIEAKKKAEQVFCVNYYVFGVLSYQKRYAYDPSNINFKPAGFQFNRNHRENNRGRGNHKPNSFLQFNTSPVQPDRNTIRSVFSMKSEEPQQACSQENCKQEAKVNCVDCDEIFCKQCSDTLHNSAKGLKKHKVTPLACGDPLELTEKCPVHTDALIEFSCDTCEKNLCCYCILGDHSGHIFHQMTKLKEENLDEFKNLVDNAEEVLKRLLISEKKARRLLERSSKPNHDNSLELAISRKIENTISKLQILEKELLVEAVAYKNQHRTLLTGVTEDILSSIRSVNNLVSISKQALDKNNPKKINFHLIRKQLEGVSETACYLLQDFEKNDTAVEFLFEEALIDDLQHSSKLQFTKSTPYRLVPQKDLPPDYEEEELETPKSIMSSSSSFIDSVDRFRDDAKPKKKFKSDIEKWIQSHDNFQQKPNASRDLDLIEFPRFQKADREIVKVSHLTSPDCFYVQLLKMTGQLNRLSKNIDRHIRSQSAINVQIPEINSIYLVKYIYDDQIHWCRGRLISEMPEHHMFNVFFIDYGNTATVRKEDIILISPDLKKLHPIAVECKFFDLYPPKGEWDPKALLLMTRIIANNELLMVVTQASQNVLEVDLITMDCDTSVRDALKFLGYGIPYYKTPTDLDRIKKELKNTETVKLYNKTEHYKKEDSVDVIISYVIDPFNVYVNMKSSKYDLTKLHDAMDSFYKNSKKGYVYSPKEDMVVAVTYSDGISSGWRRGVITGSTEGRGLVTAKLVDIGMVIYVSWDQIRKLDARFIAQDCQAKLVKMADIVPPNGAQLWPQNAIDYFTKFIKMETVLRMVISATSSPPEVVLFECHPTVHLCLNAMLVKDGLAESVGDLSKAVEWPQVYESKVSKPEEDDTYTMSMMKTIQASTRQADTAKGSNSDEESDDEYSNIFKKPIEIISAESPDCIYVKFSDNNEKQHEFHLEMKNFYMQNKLIPADWAAGSVCVVFYRKHYHRGVILEKLNNGKFLVCLRDAAITTEVKEKHLGVLNSKFTNVPEFAIRCHLADITPAGDTKKWSAISCEYLQDVLNKNKNLYLARKGVVDKERKSMPVIIWYMEILPGGALESSKTVLHSVNKILMKNGLALRTVVKKSANKVNETESPIAVDCEVDQLDDESGKSVSTETEDHECSSSISGSSVAGALKPSTSEKVDWNDLIDMQKQWPEQIIRDWMPPLPFISNEFPAISTFVNDEGEVFLHDLILEPMLKDMEQKMCEYFESRSESDVDGQWSPGEMCSVRYFLNKKWYRGKILSANGAAIKVVMVDYGNNEDCDIKDLSKEILYYDLPVFASKVTLFNVYPKEGKWVTSDLDLLHAQIVDKEIIVALKTQQITGVPPAAIIKLGTVNINDFIMQHSKNLSRINRPKSITQSASSSVDVINDSLLDNLNNQSDNDVIIEETASSNDEIGLRDNIILDNINFDDIKLNFDQARIPDCEPGEKLKIAVINVLNYNKFIFETPTSEDYEKGKAAFENMSKDINSFILEQQPVLKTFEMGKVCVARYPEDGLWYRAQIIKEIDEEHVYLWFVDFGNFETIRRDHLKDLIDDWLLLPVDQHLATIDGITLTSENNLRKVLDEVLSYCETVHMAEIVSKDPLRLKLYKEGTDTLSYQNLIDAGFLQLTDAVEMQEKTIVEIEEAESESGEDVEELTDKTEVGA